MMAKSDQQTHFSIFFFFFFFLAFLCCRCSIIFWLQYWRLKNNIIYRTYARTTPQLDKILLYMTENFDIEIFVYNLMQVFYAKKKHVFFRKKNTNTYCSLAVSFAGRNMLFLPQFDQKTGILMTLIYVYICLCVNILYIYTLNSFSWNLYTFLIK